jgi:hypothetical protein
MQKKEARRGRKNLEKAITKNPIKKINKKKTFTKKKEGAQPNPRLAAVAPSPQLPSSSSSPVTKKQLEQALHGFSFPL